MKCGGATLSYSLCDILGPSREWSVFPVKRSGFYRGEPGCFRSVIDWRAASEQTSVRPITYMTYIAYVTLQRATYTVSLKTEVRAVAAFK